MPPALQGARVCRIHCSSVCHVDWQEGRRLAFLHGNSRSTYACSTRAETTLYSIDLINLTLTKTGNCWPGRALPWVLCHAS